MKNEILGYIQLKKSETRTVQVVPIKCVIGTHKNLTNIYYSSPYNV